MPSVVAVGFLEMVRVDALGVAAAADQLGSLLQLPTMPSLPREAGGLLGAELGCDEFRYPSRAFLVERASPEQTAAGWFVLGFLVEILSKLWMLSRWEGVGRCVGVGDGMTPCRDSPAVGHPLGVSGEDGDGWEGKD